MNKARFIIPATRQMSSKHFYISEKLLSLSTVGLQVKFSNNTH